MRKYLFLIFILLLPKISFGDFLSDPTGLDLYKKIDSWIFELEVKYLDKELKWWDEWWDIVENINKIAKTYWIENSCLKWKLKTQDVKDIYFDNNPNEILAKVLKDCFDEKDGSLSTTTLNQYLKIINKTYEDSKKRAQIKVNNIYKIWRIWMYSDGIEENSPFDLMVDLQNINSIIFEEKIEYDWVNVEPKERDNSNNDNPIFLWNNDYNNPEICFDDKSWLSQNSINQIFSQNKENIHKKNLFNSYSQVNDNWIWPCNNFFCINIKFDTYNHALLGWWTNLSIEWLLKRSNEHLKKFVSTSLIQAKMTINHFEIWLKDLNLPDIFHVWLQVSYKPVPLLDVDKNDKDDDDEFKYKNLLTRYYRNLGLDFERANDLNIFKKKENEMKSLLDSQELGQKEVVNKTDNLNFYINQIKKENEFVSQTVIDKKIIEEDMSDFYKQFLELESFSRAFMDYSIWLKWIIWKMNEIPQTWKN